MDQMRSILKGNRICAILRNIPTEKAVSYAQAAYNGGVRMFEVALNSPDAYRQISLLAAHFGGKAHVGAGTAQTAEMVDMAVESGAGFILAPSSTVEVLAHCRDSEIPLLPGVMTPTDVDTCIRHGFTVLKLFPAGDLPDGYIKSLKGPFDRTDYVAVGGVNADNAAGFIKRGFLGVGMGSQLIPKEYLESENWREAALFVEKIVREVNGVTI